MIEALAWQGPVYEIAAISKQGTGPLSGDLMTAIEHLDAEEAEDPDRAAQELAAQSQMQAEARERIETLRNARAAERRAQKEARDEDDEDDHDVEVEYRS